MDLITPKGPRPHDGFLVVLKKHRGPSGKQSPMCRKSRLGFASCHWSVACVGKGHKRKETDVRWWSVFLIEILLLSQWPSPGLWELHVKSIQQNPEFRCGFLQGPLPDAPHPLLSWAQNSVAIYTAQFPWQAGEAGTLGRGVAGRGLWDGFFSLLLRSSPGEKMLPFLFYSHLVWWRVSIATWFLPQVYINSCLLCLKRKFGHSIPIRECVYRSRE